MNAKTIREALNYEARNNLAGNAALKLQGFAAVATDAELVRFRDLLLSDEAHPAAAADSSDLARANLD